MGFIATRSFLAALALAGAGWMPLSAHAEPVAAAEAKAVRAVVEAQLAAFAADDANAAFAQAAPSIRGMFGTAEAFVAMVRAGYPVVYRPRSVSFLAPLRSEGSVVQGVHMSDANGTLWLALYQLEQQPDKSWRIAGCTLQPANGKMT